MNALVHGTSGLQTHTARLCKASKASALRCGMRTCAVTTSAPSAPPRETMYNASSRPKTTGKTVVITGGSQGIGRATASRFAREGYNVVIAAREPTRVASAAEELAAASGARENAALGVPTDITDPAAVQRLVERVVDTYDSVDVVINCAGVCATGRLQAIPLQVFQDQINVNFLGAVAITQGFVPALEAAAKRGAKPVVAMVNSFAGRIPLRSMPAYTASKYALAGFTDAIRPELADVGIHVAQIHPGVVRTAFLQRAKFLGDDGPDRRARLEAMLDNRAPGVQTSEEVADALWSAVTNRRKEVVVGVPFKLLTSMYHTFGFNPFTIPG